MLEVGTGDPMIREEFQKVLRLQKSQTAEWTIKKEFFNRLGALILDWIHRNFDSEGQLAGGWAPLKPSTVFGRRGGSSRILQDTGKLKQSFTMQVTADGLVVGTASEIAPYHHYGTRPYEIYPRTKKALAFPAAPGQGGNVQRTRPYGTPRVGMVGNLQSLAVVRHVHHPGLPARQLLPNRDQMLQMVQQVAQSLMSGPR